jgi:molybdate transport system permease protein
MGIHGMVIGCLVLHASVLQGGTFIAYPPTAHCDWRGAQQDHRADYHQRTMDWQAARVSLLLAALTVALLLPLGLWLGRWLALTQSRAKPWVEALLLLPLLLPPTVLGFYFLIGFGQGAALGRWLHEALGLQLVFSFEGLLLASLLVNIPFMVQPIQRAFANIAPSIREAAWVGGLSRWRSFQKIELPLAAPGVLAGMALTLAHTLGEFGVVLMVGGSIAGETRTLSIAIYDRVQAFDEAAAHWMAATLLLCSLAALVAVFASARRQR